MVWPIVYWGWQYECCGEPFSVADRVQWSLLATVGGEPWMPASWMLEADLQPEDVPGSSAVRVGGVVVYTPDKLATPRRDRVIFYEGHHGDVPECFPPTEGIVRRIRLATVTYRQGQPLAGSAELREVARMPSRFVAGPGSQYRSEVGVLVDLDCTQRPGA